MEPNLKTEVLIIGYGGAGAAAAITAHDEGAKVLIVEKMEHGGGNTNTALGGFLSLMDLDRGLLYLESLCSRVYKAVDSEVIRAFAKECFRNRQWLENLGAKTHVYGGAAFSQLPGADSVEKRMITGKNTVEENAFWNFLRSHVEKRQIPVIYNAPAKDLITDSKGDVTGAIICRNGKNIAVNAAKAVILTCGGFEFNEWMKKNYLKGYPYYSLGSPGNTGDGLSMAKRIGADFWHVTGVSTILGFKSKDYKAGFFIKPASNHYIYVDKRGKRFASEFTEIHAYNYIVDFFDPHTLDFPRIPCFMIFDETARKSGPMAITAFGYNRGKYKWSKDNSEEVRKGWIESGNTLIELADKINIEPDSLKETVKKYNRHCKTGKDPDYNRPNDKLAPIENSPYYAMKLWPCLINTQGGPRRNHKAQVLYPDGTPIKRLYSAGELGSLFGLLYQGGGNLGECLAFGRIAGKEAAAL